MMTEPTIMPSIRGPRARPAKRANTTSRTVAVVAALLIATLAAGLVLWPRGNDAPAVTVDAAPAPDAPSPAIATPPTPLPAPPPTILGVEPTEPKPQAPNDPPAPRPAPRFSFRQEVRNQAARSPPPPQPGEVLCTLPPNYVIGLTRTVSITTELGDFHTFANPLRACGRPVDLAIEHTPSGMVVNGFSFNRRPACTDFSTTVIELVETPDRWYAAWILPQGAVINACPDSQPLSTLSRAKRTPRQRSSRSPRPPASTIPTPPRPSSTETGASSFDAWNGPPAQP